MANMKIEKITLEVSQEELGFLKLALQCHINEAYEHEREMRILLKELEG
ncbi:hypothetical protein ACFC1L_39785 [Streptomyces sp. NPDC056210]